MNCFFITETWWYHCPSRRGLVMFKSHVCLFLLSSYYIENLIGILFASAACFQDLHMIHSPKSYTKLLKITSVFQSQNWLKQTLQFATMLVMLVFFITWTSCLIACLDIREKLQWPYSCLIPGHLSDRTVFGQKQRLCCWRTSSSPELFRLFLCLLFISTFARGVFENIKVLINRLSV